MSVYLVGMILLFGLGAFILVFLLLTWLSEALVWLLARRRRGADRLLAAERREAQPYRASPDELLGLSRIPWMYLYALALLAGLGLYLFTHQLAVFLLAAVPFAVRAWLAGYRKRQLNAETLAFLIDVRIVLPLQGSLLRALQDVAQRGGTRLAKAAARYLAAGFQGSGLQLLERLAQDTHLPALQDLVAWMQAAEAGTMGSDVPFEHTLSRLRSEMVTALREQMQRIPTRLTVLVLPSLLGPTIVLLLYPVVARLLASMAGVGWGGGF